LYSESEDIDQLDASDSRECQRVPGTRQMPSLAGRVDLTEDQPPAKKALAGLRFLAKFKARNILIGDWERPELVDSAAKADVQFSVV
jgi:hypothetical protein